MYSERYIWDIFDWVSLTKIDVMGWRNIRDLCGNKKCDI